VSVDVLVRAGLAAALAGRRDQAGQGLLGAVERDEHNETAWYWLSTVIDGEDDQEIALENVLALNPHNASATQALEKLRARRTPPPAAPEPPPPSLREMPGLPPFVADTPAPAPSSTATRAGLPPFVADTPAPPPAASRTELPPFVADTPAPAAPTRAGLPPFVADTPARPERSSFGAAPPPSPRGEEAPAIGAARGFAPPPPAPAEPASFAPPPEPVTPGSAAGRVRRPTIGGGDSETSNVQRGDPAARESRGAVTPASNRVGTGYEELIGQIIGGRYRVISLFSQGTSTLLLAADNRRKNMVLIRPETFQATASRRVSTKPAFTQNGIAFYISSISIGGLNLRNFVGTVGTLPGPQVTEYGLRLCAEAKKRGSLLKARFWSLEGVKIDDSGHIVVAADAGSPEATARPGPLSPPEHAAGGTLDGRSDVYLIGAVMFYLATGSLQPAPDRVPTPTPYRDARGQTVSGLVEAEFRLHPGLHPLLAGLLATALQGDPAARYASVEHLEAALRAVNATLLGQAPAALVVPRTQEKAKDDVSGKPAPGRALLRLAAVIALMGVAGLIVVFLLWQVGSGVLGTPQATALTPEASPSAEAGLPIGADATPPDAATLTIGDQTPAATPEEVAPSTPDPAAVFVEAAPENVERLAITQIDAHRYPRVTAYVSVISPDGRPVVHMGHDNFVILHNGVTVRDFAFSDMNSQADPVSTYLILDTSGSMQGEPLARAKEAAETFVDHTQNGDFFGLISFNTDVRMVRDFTPSRNQLKTRLADLQADGGTALWDAVYTATTRIEQQAGRRAMILLSDGGDTASKQQTGSTALNAARHAGVPIFVVGLRSADFDETVLSTVAQQSGGELWVAPAPEDLPGIYERLAYRFAAQYKVTFTVGEPADEQPRDLAIIATVGDKTVQDGRQYYASSK
jgi:VWFA-related protein